MTKGRLTLWAVAGFCAVASVLLWGRAVTAEAGLAALDAEYGFRGVSFGDDVSSVKGLKKVGERGECEIAYQRPSDKLDFEGVPLTGIEYSFQNDRFTLVSLLAQPQHCVRLYHALRAKYGEDMTKLGEQGLQKPFWTATWQSKRVRIDLTGPVGCIATISAPEEAILEERRCREDDRVKAGPGH